MSVLVNNIEAKPIPDTGSCVSTISKTFYEQIVSHLELLLLGWLVILGLTALETVFQTISGRLQERERDREREREREK